MTDTDKALAEELTAQIAHVLSEWLNDNAPIGEAMYRAPANAVIPLAQAPLLARINAAQAENTRLREALRRCADAPVIGLGNAQAFARFTLAQST